MAEDNIYTQDGTININRKPANKKKSGNWKACWFILGNECSERLAYYGMSTNLVNYLQAATAKSVNTWTGTYYITPLLGTFLADACLGRYWTIASFSIIYAIGMILLTLSASVPGLKPSCDANGCHPTSAQTAACFVGLYLIALGTGGIKPCVSSFGADQFDEADEKERKKKSSFFNWFYLSINIGALVASLQIPGGSPLTRICQVIVAASRKFSLQVPDDESLLHETVDVESVIKGSRKLDHTNYLRCLDKAAVETQLQALY